jgi:hypothetical protein
LQLPLHDVIAPVKTHVIILNTQWAQFVKLIDIGRFLTNRFADG